MAAQHPSYEAESVEESLMMPAACGQPGEGTVATDDMLKPRCLDSIPPGSRSPNTELYSSEKTAPEPLLAMKKKAAIASMPYENGGVTAIASSMSTSETQTATVPPQRPGHEVNNGVTSRKEPGSVKGGPLAAEPSDHQIERRDENSLGGTQHQEHSGLQATQAAVMQRNLLARPSASLPGAAEQSDQQMEGDDNGFGEQRQENGGPQATQAAVMQHNLARPSASLPGAAEQSDHQMEGDDDNELGEQRQEHSGPQATQAAVMHSLPTAAEQRERSHGRRGEDGHAITHDGVDVVVDLRRAREQAGQWRTSNRLCREENPPVSVVPCGHHIVCPRCFHGPYPGAANSRCPVCCQPIEDYKFNQAMLDLFGLS